ncbi:hypothetical protein EJ08DRAFT_737801 [Tothia fuscella]|uniref:Uncharacterized protein n=1 Tax=Tothia fuscella TaxID=1048955 RepID=A0A9P4TU37_9PEZI|nr:hypothetical protein EJ08DRAFT_737801 [Tothia fuscella]
MTASISMAKHHSHFLALPRELRDSIYSFYAGPKPAIPVSPTYTSTRLVPCAKKPYPHCLILVSRQVSKGYNDCLVKRATFYYHYANWNKPDGCHPYRLSVSPLLLSHVRICALHIAQTWVSNFVWTTTGNPDFAIMIASIVSQLPALQVLQIKIDCLKPLRDNNGMLKPDYLIVKDMPQFLNRVYPAGHRNHQRVAEETLRWFPSLKEVRVLAFGYCMKCVRLARKLGDGCVGNRDGNDHFEVDVQFGRVCSWKTPWLVVEESAGKDAIPQVGNIDQDEEIEIQTLDGRERFVF